MVATYCWVEQAAANAEEHPCEDCQREPECERRVEELLRRLLDDFGRHLVTSIGVGRHLGRLSAAEGEEEELQFTPSSDHLLCVSSPKSMYSQRKCQRIHQ
jgi:hypothetical protein